MVCELGTSGPRYSWCPQDPEGVDHYQLGLYLKKTMGQEWGEWWVRQIDYLSGRDRTLDKDDVRLLVDRICKYDSPALIRLLYPAAPELFLTPHCSMWGELNAVALCAKQGSILCLEELLSLGADPNGLDCPTAGNRMQLAPGEEGIPVTPLDCARIAEQEECCFLLELYGGVTVQRLCGLKESEMPRSYLRAMMNKGKGLV